MVSTNAGSFTSCSTAAPWHGDEILETAGPDGRLVFAAGE
jgi:hypothetical protein